MKIKGGIKTMLSARFGKKLTVKGEMMGDGEWSSIYSLL